MIHSIEHRKQQLVGMAGLILWLGVCTNVHSESVPEQISFNRDIRPILSDKCFFCHGPDDKHREAKLRLDTRDGAVRDLGGYAAIVPGNIEDSELWLRITSDDKKEVMPPLKTKKTLSAHEKTLIKKWIEQGATYEGHWAYTKPVKVTPSAIKGDTWSRNAIDRFILRRLKAEGFQPSKEADRHTLIRRLYFDLTGLPPTPEQVKAFEQDKSLNGYEKVVDRLPTSPHYGERMAMHWLDLVRFADTVGYHGDQDHNITPYRDYVIKAFNDNLPYNQFTIEQLAGDLLDQPTMWQQIATGYNRMLQTSHEGGVQPAEYLHKYFADRVRNVSAVWLGLTMGCAECHNHKYDPISQKDFYSFGAFFADIHEREHLTKGTNSLPTKRAPEIKVWDLPTYEKMRAIDAQIAKIKAGDEPSIADASGIASAVAKLEKEKKLLATQFRLCMVTQSIKPREIRILPRGDFLNLTGPVVQPAVPETLGKLSKTGRATRLDLARWLVSKDNPLAARAFVNRIWAMLFARGLAMPLDDFGAQGAPPTHPQLLDWLAVEFMDKGWDVKHLIKTIVMSAAYQQSSLQSTLLRQRDPKNQLFARQSRWRVDAEMVRDNALALSGLLVKKIGGHSVKPYQPEGYYQHLNFPRRKYSPHHDDRQWRRGVYIHWQRMFLHPMLKAFDAPMREECTAQRTRSNTPLAALVLMNDPTFVEAARAFAQRIVLEGGNDRDEAIRWACQQALQREPHPRELALLRQLFVADLADYKRDPAAAKLLISIGLSPAIKEVHAAELAAWTSVARALLNLSETMTRN